MQHQLAASSAQQSSRQEDLGPQGGGLPESFQPRDSLEFTQQVKQHQDGTEGSFRGEELAQAEGTLHVCGELCAQKLQSQFMGNVRDNQVKGTGRLAGL